LCSDGANPVGEDSVRRMMGINTQFSLKNLNYRDKNICCVSMFIGYDVVIVRGGELTFEMVQVITDAVSAGCIVFVPEWFDLKLGLLKWDSKNPMDFESCLKYYRSIPWNKLATNILDNWGLNIFNRLIIDYLKSQEISIYDPEPYEIGLVIDKVFKSGANSTTELKVKWSMEVSTTPKIFIATPCYGNMLMAPYVSSLVSTIKLLEQKGIGYVTHFMGNESLIQRARNVITQKFLNSNCTHLLFIDSDIQWEPQAIIDLLEFNKDVSCCVYPKKAYNWEQFINSYKIPSKESLHSRGLDFNINVQPKYERNGDFIKVIDSATGFMLINKDILIKIIKKYPQLTVVNDTNDKSVKIYCAVFDCMIDPETHCYLSEDYAFCRRVYDVGGEVWINIKHNLVHYGNHGFSSDIGNRQNIERLV